MQRLAQLTIRGRVQGVFYRQSTKREAHGLGLQGWVRNQADGTVLVLVSGPEPAIKALIGWCQQGPPSAKVDTVEVRWIEHTDAESEKLSEYELKFSDKFEIR